MMARRIPKTLIVVSMLALYVGSVRAQEDGGADRTRVAVLHLHAGTADINFKFATHLTDKVREVVRSELPADRFLHVSKEKILALEAGAECTEDQDQCKLTVAKQLRLDLAVTGEISKEDEVYLYTLRLIRVANGEVVAVTTGPPVYEKTGLGKALAKTAAELVGVLSKARVKITSIPAGAGAVLDRTGKEACTTPCELQVEPGEHVIDVIKEGYQSFQARVSVGEMKMVELHANMEKSSGEDGPHVSGVPGPEASRCEKSGYDFRTEQTIVRSGDCGDMTGLLEECKRCRKETKRRYKKARERCVETNLAEACEAEKAAKRTYDEEVRQYRTLVKRMRQFHCPGTPR